MYHWLDVNVPLSYNYWVNKKDYHLENAVYDLMQKMVMQYNLQKQATMMVYLWAQDDDEQLCIQCKDCKVGPAIIEKLLLNYAKT